MNILNTIGYDPFDDLSKSGYRRPPKDAAAVCDYFAVLGVIEDEGWFAHQEMEEMLNAPNAFFNVSVETNKAGHRQLKVYVFCPPNDEEGMRQMVGSYLDDGWEWDGSFYWGGNTDGKRKECMVFLRRKIQQPLEEMEQT